MQPTIRDVAQLAGVSTSTVSRVLNGEKGVSAETARRVMEAVETLRYRPNRVAQSLVTRRTRTVGLVIPDQRNPFYAQASWMAERVARGMGYGVMVCNSDNDPGREMESLRLLEAHQVDGLLLIGGVRDITHVVNFSAASKTPMVLVDRVAVGYRIPSVVLDNVKGGRLITQSLLDMGHRRIAFVTSGYTMAEQDRYIGYERALEANGITPDPALVFHAEEFEWKQGKLDALEQMLRRPDRPTAILSSNDLKALAVYRLLRRSGLRVPEDVSVAGYDDIEIADLVSPPLTTVAQPINDMASAGMQMLLDIVEGRVLEGDSRTFEPQLVIRQSTAPPRTPSSGRAVAGSVESPASRPISATAQQPEWGGGA